MQPDRPGVNYMYKRFKATQFTIDDEKADEFARSVETFHKQNGLDPKSFLNYKNVYFGSHPFIMHHAIHKIYQRQSLNVQFKKVELGPMFEQNFKPGELYSNNDETIAEQQFIRLDTDTLT